MNFVVLILQNTDGNTDVINEGEFNSSTSTFQPHKADQFYFYQGILKPM